MLIDLSSAFLRWSVIMAFSLVLFKSVFIPFWWACRKGDTKKLFLEALITLMSVWIYTALWALLRIFAFVFFSVSLAKRGESDFKRTKLAGMISGRHIWTHFRFWSLPSFHKNIYPHKSTRKSKVYTLQFNLNFVGQNCIKTVWRDKETKKIL